MFQIIINTYSFDPCYEVHVSVKNLNIVALLKCMYSCLGPLESRSPRQSLVQWSNPTYKAKFKGQYYEYKNIKALTWDSYHKITMVLTALSFLARLGVITASTIVLGLNGVFIADRSWLTGVLVYIEAITAISIVGAIIPPYPNFLYDFILFIALIVAAVFALIVQVRSYFHI